MRVTVKLIATYRKLLPEGAPGGSVEVEVTQGTRAADLLDGMGVPANSASVILVNGHVPEPDDVLEEGDAVVAFPAMAGGSGRLLKRGTNCR